MLIRLITGYVPPLAGQGRVSALPDVRQPHQLVKLDYYFNSRSPEMVSPITGPFSTTVSQEPAFNMAKTWYRQKRPYNLPLTYTLRQARVTKVQGGYESSASGAYSGIDQAADAVKAAVVSAAYEKLKGRVDDSASIGETLAEYNQAAAMIGERAKNLVQLTRALRKLDFSEAARLVRKQAPPSALRDWRGSARGFGGLFLEWHFGWSPFVSDIDSSLKILVSPGPLHKRVYGKASSPYQRKIVGTGLPAGYVTYTEESGTYKCKQGARMQVTNHNLYLASQLGLANPVETAWNLIPFSFLVDHVVNVSQFLSTGTDFLGLTLTESYTSRVNTGTRINYTSWPAQNYFRYSVYEAVRIDRTTALSAPSLFVRPFRIKSWTRAATYMSLLAQALR